MDRDSAFAEFIQRETDRLVKAARTEAAAKVRAYAETRPAGEAFALEKLAKEIEA